MFNRSRKQTNKVTLQVFLKLTSNFYCGRILSAYIIKRYRLWVFFIRHCKTLRELTFSKRILASLAPLSATTPSHCVVFIRWCHAAQLEAAVQKGGLHGRGGAGVSALMGLCEDVQRTSRTPQGEH